MKAFGLGLSLIGIGDVPVAIGNDVDGRRTRLLEQVEQLLDGLLTRRKAIQPRIGGNRPCRQDKLVDLIKTREGCPIRLDVTHPSHLHRLRADKSLK